MVYSTNIEPVISLKRASDSRLCVLCQQRHISKDDVRQSTECSSCLNVYEAMKMRIMLRDIDHREAIERLEGVIESLILLLPRIRIEFYYLSKIIH